MDSGSHQTASSTNEALRTVGGYSGDTTPVELVVLIAQKRGLRRGERMANGNEGSTPALGAAHDRRLKLDCGEQSVERGQLYRDGADFNGLRESCEMPWGQRQH